MTAIGFYVICIIFGVFGLPQLVSHGWVLDATQGAFGLLSFGITTWLWKVMP